MSDLLHYRCPRCSAKPDESCTDINGKRCNPHSARLGLIAAAQLSMQDRAMRGRGDLEVAWFSVVNVCQEEV